MLFAVFLSINFFSPHHPQIGLAVDSIQLPTSFGPDSRTRPAELSCPGAITDQTGSQQNCVPVAGGKGAGIQVLPLPFWATVLA